MKKDTVLTNEMVETHLRSIGFDNSKAKHQFHIQGYYLTNLGADSFGCVMIGVHNKRFDESVFRGRIISIEQLDQVLFMVKEDYDLNDKEVAKII